MDLLVLGIVLGNTLSLLIAVPEIVLRQT